MSRTAEQQAAAERLRGLPGRPRVREDAEGWPVIAGRYGRVEWDTPGVLAVFTDHRRMIAKLAAVPGVGRYQTGDTEARRLLDPTAYPEVATLIRVRRLRSAATAKHLVAHAYRATNPTLEASGRRGDGPDGG
jgi:hypothetical protein